MIKKILVLVFFHFSILAVAQQATSSPYSFFGIGDVRFKGTVENRLMGGIGVFPDSIHINLQNPASYSSLKLASFTLGGGFTATRINSYQGNDKAQRTTIDYMAVGIPIGKSSGVTLSLEPYSAVGYKIKSVDASGITRKYEGKGGLNKVSLGYGYQINPSLSVGADLNYNFGNIQTNNIKYIPDVEFGTQETNTSEMAGFNVNIGTMYQKKINKHDFYGSLAFTPQSNLSVNNTRIIASIQYTGDFTPGVIDFLEASKTRSTLKLPGKIAIGAGFGQAKKWLVGSEVTFKQTANLNNRFNDVNEATYKNGIKYSFGGYYIPNYNSFSNYFKKVTYRAGFRYEKTGMIIRNEPIKDYAITGGFGLPLGGAFSNLNIGVEYGRRGTAKANLVEENYTNVILSLSLNDKWFVQRKFD